MWNSMTDAEIGAQAVGHEGNEPDMGPELQDFGARRGSYTNRAQNW